MNKRASKGYVIIKDKNEAQPKYYSYRQTPTIHSRIKKRKRKKRDFYKKYKIMSELKTCNEKNANT